MRIVLQSDHLYHSLAELRAGPELERNTVIFLGGPEVGVVNDIAGSMVDVFPTLMDWLGFEVSAGGLGRSMLAVEGEPTLVTRHGLDTLNAALLGATDLVAILWQESKTP